MSPKKPTGEIGPNVIRNSASGPDATWELVSFPTEKAAIERWFAEKFVAAVRKGGGVVMRIDQNPEDDLDFTLTLPGGRVDLELREFLYVDSTAPPYDSRQITIKSYRYAEQLAAAVHMKSSRYMPNSKVPIHLLLYITHWRFYANEIAIRLAQHFIRSSPPIFENVFLVWPLAGSEAALRVLYPSTDPLEGHSPDQFRDATYMNLDPSKWEVKRGGS